MPLREPFNTWKEQIQHQLDALVPDQPGPVELLYRAARYSLLGEGKRLRPLLTLVVTDMLDFPVEKALTAAAAIEMIHTYSMIHDDLPCMDNDNFRRGKPTLHKVYPESYAILAGDFLLNHAFEVLAKEENLSIEMRLELIQILAKKGGGEGMIGGQMMDILAEKIPVSLQTLEELHLKKTGALITAAIECGALIGRASPETRKIFIHLGEQIGLAFQIQNDILDIEHGKELSSDLANQKSTYVSLLGLEKAKDAAYLLHQQAEKTLKTLSLKSEKLQELLTFFGLVL